MVPSVSASGPSLAELDGVPWQSLTHAYGPATDVPGLVRTLGSTIDEAVVANVEHKLWCAVLHQGNVYPATAPTLPFVFVLLRDRRDLRPVFVDWLTDLSWVLADGSDSRLVADCRAALVDAVDGLAHFFLTRQQRQQSVGRRRRSRRTRVGHRLGRAGRRWVR